MTDELAAVIEGAVVGRVTQDRNGQLSFTYEDSWRDGDNSYPISLSLPLAASEHKHDPVQAFLWGLLPDNDRILEAWGRRFGVSARNPFRLVEYVGEECAGAVQFVRPDRLQEILTAGPERIDWLSEADVAERLRTLRLDHAAWRRLGDEGQFSLAGAQPKTALHFRDGRWGIPSGRTPTTHILKPPTTGYDGFSQNEHICLELAAELGLPAALSKIMRFGEEIAIVIERYDRVRTERGVVRIHQEDLCQALGIPPLRKYENDGGPGVSQIVGLLRQASRAPADDLVTFVEALGFNWIVAGTDGHAKNFSILIDATGSRLAPLYDLASALPYPELSPHKIKLAMRIGGEYLIRKIGRRHWEKMADQVRMPRGEVLETVERLALRVPDAIREVIRRVEVEGLNHPMLARIETEMVGRAKACLDQLSQATGPSVP